MLTLCVYLFSLLMVTKLPLGVTDDFNCMCTLLLKLLSIMTCKHLQLSHKYNVSIVCVCVRVHLCALSLITP